MQNFTTEATLDNNGINLLSKEQFCYLIKRATGNEEGV